MHPTLEKLLAAGPVTTDGAWATQLQARTARRACPDAWNLARPDVVRAGRPGLCRGRQPGHSDQHLRRESLHPGAARSGRPGGGDQRGGRGHLPPRGGRPGAGLRLDGPERRDAADGRGRAKTRFGPPSPNRPQALARAGADGIVVETMSDLAEAVLAVAAAARPACPWSPHDLRLAARTRTAR